MSNKILKYELVFLFFFAMLSVLAYFFGSGLSDNAFVVTSDSNTIGFFTYYLSSFIMYVGYFSGPWLLPVFFAEIILFVTVFSKRASWYDSLAIIPLCLLGYCSTYLFVPSFMGDGVRLFTLKSIGITSIVMVFLVSIPLVLWSILQKRFVVFFRELLTKKRQQIQDPTARYRAAAAQPKFSFWKSLRMKIAGRLKGSDKKQIGDKSIFAIKGNKDQMSIFDVAEESNAPAESPAIKREDKIAPAEQHAEVPFEEQLEKAEEQEQENSIAPADDPIKTQVENKLERMGARESYIYSELFRNVEFSNSAEKQQPPDSYFGDIVTTLETKLGEYSITGQIVNIMKGPVVDTFELELGPGMKASKVSNRAEDLSIALLGKPVRVVFPLPGKSTVGIEVPRDPREIIALDEIVNDQKFMQNKCNLPIAMGKDAYGRVLIEDLTKMPHLLVAGATRSGKSVFLNTVLISLLIKKSPKELKLILVDPKKLELAPYHEVPHLALPVVTEPKMAAVSLLWAVQEMERRYEIMKEFGVRNVESFNDKLKTASIEDITKIHHFYENQLEEDGYEIPYIVVVVDEFADLMLTQSGKEIEMYVNRLAAKARAAGIHLIIATQRPSVKVITGNIKSNFPSRVAFKVQSGVDSRVILDMQGAEKLLGNGDMLFNQGVNTIRAHSAFISDSQVGEIVSCLSGLKKSFIPGAIDFIENGGEAEEEQPTGHGYSSGPVPANRLDDRYNEALEIAYAKGTVSASMLQREMGIGYPKAGKIIDQMEKNGVVGPARGSKPREVLSRGTVGEEE